MGGSWTMGHWWPRPKGGCLRDREQGQDDDAGRMRRALREAPGGPGGV